MSSLTDTVVDGKFRIEKALGSGGFGTVYKAWQADLERFVALKLLSETALQDSDGLQRFEREAKALNAIRHKNIVAFYGFGALKDSYYIAMELVDGASLDRIISQRRIKPEQAVNIANQLLDALGAAHAFGVVHRDLKPSNILFADGGLNSPAKIIDFGLVKLMPGYGMKSQALTEAGMALGSAKYMSPEQCTGNQEVDHRSDLYGVGCILFGMLTGAAPFEADEGIAMMVQHVNAQPPSLSEYFGQTATARKLDAIFQKAMEKNPEARYGSAQEFRDALATLNSTELNEIEIAPPAVQAQIAAKSKQIKRTDSAKTNANRFGALNVNRKQALLVGGALALGLIFNLTLFTPSTRFGGALSGGADSGNSTADSDGHTVDSEGNHVDADGRTRQRKSPVEKDACGLGGDGSGKRARFPKIRRPDFRSMTLPELYAKRAEFLALPDPNITQDYFKILAEKERAAKQYYKAIAHFRTSNELALKLNSQDRVLKGTVAIGEMGSGMHLPLSDWLPDVETGIAYAQQTKHPEFESRLEILAAKGTGLQDQISFGEKIRKWLEAAVQAEQRMGESETTFHSFSRGEPELMLAKFYSDRKQTAESIAHLGLAAKEMSQFNNTDQSFFIDQTAPMMDLIQQYRDQVPRDTVEMGLKSLGTKRASEPYYMTVDRNNAKAQLLLLLGRTQEIKPFFDDSLQITREHSNKLMEATVLELEAAVEPMPPSKQVELASRAVALCRAVNPEDSDLVAGSYAILAKCYLRGEDYPNAALNFKRAGESSLQMVMKSVSDQQKFRWSKRVVRQYIAGAYCARLGGDLKTQDALLQAINRLLTTENRAALNADDQKFIALSQSMIDEVKRGNTPELPLAGGASLRSIRGIPFSPVSAKNER